MTGRLLVAAAALLLRAVAQLRGTSPRHTIALPNESDARQLPEDCEAISWADLCERQLSSGECFQLQPGTTPAGCRLQGPSMALAPAQLQGAAPGVVTTCGTGGELRIIGQIQVISLRLDAETIVFEDAQVEAWHEAPDLSIEAGGAFHSKGPLTLTRSNLTVRGTGAVKGGALAAGDLTLVSSSLRVLNAAAADSGGGFYGEGTLRLRQLSKVLIENVSAHKGNGAGFFVTRDADVSDSGLIDIKNARFAKIGGGFFVKQRLQLTNHSTVRIRHATAAGLGGGFATLDEVVIAGMSNVSISDAVATGGGGFYADKRLQMTSNSTLNLQNVKAGKHGGGVLSLGEVEIRESSTVMICNSHAVSGSGGGFVTDDQLNVSNGSTLIILNATAGKEGGGFFAGGKVEIGGSSTVRISNTHAVSGDGGGFLALNELKVSNGSSLIILNATAGSRGRGLFADGKVAIDNSAVSIQQATAAEFGGGALVFDEVVIAGMSNVSISDTVATEQGGGFAVQKRLKVTNNSTLNLQNVKAGRNGGGLFALAEVDIDGSSTVKVSNSQAHSGDGGGLLIEKGLNISSGSTLIILNATAASHGGGFWVGGEMLALSNSTVSVQHATAGKWGGGFLASDQVVIAAGSTVSISDAVAAESGGGFQVRKHLQVMCKSTLNIQNVKAGDSGGGFNAEGQVEVRESSIVKISNSHAVSASGGGFHTNELNIFNRSVLIILNATAGSSGGGFHSSGKAAVFSSSTISIQHTRAGLFGGGFIAVDKVVIAGRSTVSIFDAVAADQGGGFQVEKHLQVTSHSTLNLQDVKAGKHGGGFHAFQEVEIAGSSTVKISNSQAVSESGGGFDAIELNIFNRSALIILNATAGRYGGAFVCEHRVSMRSSTVHIQHTKAGSGGGGLYAIGEVDIGGSSTVKISNSHTVSGYGGGLYAKKELKVSNRSALMILNATAPGNGGGFYAGGKVAISSSTVSIQRARAGKLGGGFCAEGSIALSDASTVAMSDTHAGVDGGGFMVATALATHNSSMSTANSTAERTGTAGRVDGQVLLSSQSSLDIHHAEGDANSAVLAASCLQLHPESSLFLEGIIGRHGLYLQNSCSSSLCSNTTFHVAEGAALDATGRLSSGLLSVNACPHEEVRLSGIHLRSWNSSLLTTRPRYVVVDNVNIHYLPPVDHLQVLAAQENFSIDSLAISCPDCPQGVTFNATEDGTLQALSPENLHCSKAFTVSNGFTPRCACSDYQITSEHFRNTELVSLEDVFRTCRFCNRHSYFQDGSCRPCEIYRAWSDGKRDVCHVLPHESPERVILFMGAAVFVILTFIAFEILHAPLVILDAKSDIEDPSEVAAKRIFTVSVKGPITSLPTSISRLLHQRVRYRARGTGLQWLDFDPQKSKAIKVCSVAQKKFLLQDAHVPFDCASCRGSLHATETCVMVTLLIALLFLLAILPTIIKVAVVSGNGLQHTFVTSVFYIALPMAAVAAVLHWPVAWLIQGLYRRTPFSEALDDYRKQIHCKPHPGPDATHPRNQGLLVLTLRGLWKHFESFILERNMHFVVANIVRPLTQSKGVSFVTLWGGRQVDYFVSHSWGTSFSHFVQSIRCHALSKEGSASWIDAAYWICSFANNQWNIAAELADDPMDSAFARALRGGIKGVAMVLDQEVQPLTRVWCLFEFLLSSREQLELVFTTDLGVVGDDGCASFDIALEVGNKIECLEVAKCQASSDEDKRKIFEYIINTLGSLESMDGRIKHLMGQMLKKNLANVGSATDSLLHRLGQS